MLPARVGMRIVALIAATLLGLVGLPVIFGANSGAGLGPVELIGGLLPIGIAALFVRISDVPKPVTSPFLDCRAARPDEARVCRQRLRVLAARGTGHPSARR